MGPHSSPAPSAMLPAGTRATIGWIAPMAHELFPATQLLEGCLEGHMPPETKDTNRYYVGRIGEHWVAMAVARETGTNQAASLCTDMIRSFPDIRHILVVGIAGGVPCYGMSKREEIALGDVVVSVPRYREGGVASYETGAYVRNGVLSHGGHLNHPPTEMLGAIANLKHDHKRSPPCGDIPNILREMQRVVPDFRDPGDERDILFNSDYEHGNNDKGVELKRCEGLCDFSQSVRRSQRGKEMLAVRAENSPFVHYGTIASGNALIKSTTKRDQLEEDFGAIAVEMESAGVLSVRPALVVRGICDYADSHKNKDWQDYAAATAAAYARELVLRLAPPPKFPPPSAPEPEKVVFDCMRSLAFEDMLSREHAGPATDGTCQWLVDHAGFKAWRDSRGLLCLKGKTGSGKSTLLRYTIDKNQSAEEGGDLVLSFFFYGRGAELRKCPLGFYRALAHQVLLHAPKAQESLVREFKNRCDSLGEPSSRWQWTEGELQKFLQVAISEVLESRPVWIFVDALDENGKANADNLSKWFENLSGELQQTSSPCRICVSCRPYPAIKLNANFTISVEQENGQDLSNYVNSAVSVCPDIAQSSIPGLIASRAAGMFMWARIIIKRMLELHESGWKLEVIAQEINQAPAEIGNVYGKMIEKMSPASLKLMRWVCLAEWPLSLDELRWAMVVDERSVLHRKESYMALNTYATDNATMERQVRALGCGLLEMTAPPDTGTRRWFTTRRPTAPPRRLDDEGDEDLPDADQRPSEGSSPGADTPSENEEDEEPFELEISVDRGPAPGERVVRFIHQSVKDFFLNGGLLQLEKKFGLAGDDPTPPEAGGSNGPRKIREYLPFLTMSENNEGMVGRQALEKLNDDRQEFAESVSRGHIQIIGICSRYLAMENIGKSRLEPQDELDAFPLLRYAIKSWDRHVYECRETSAATRITTDDILAPFRFDARKDVADMWGLTLEAHEVPTHCSPEAMLLRACAILGAARPLKDALGQGDAYKRFAGNRDVYGYSSVDTANFEGHGEVIHVLGDIGGVDVNRNFPGSELNPLSYALMCEDSDAIAGIINSGNANLEDEGPALLRLAVGAWGEEGVYIVRLLLGTGQIDVNSRDAGGRTALSYAVVDGREDMVKVLLEKGGADASMRYSGGRTLLNEAMDIQGGNVVRMVKLLLATGQIDVNSKDDNGWTALTHAASAGREDVVGALVEAGGADPTSMDNEGRTPILRADANGHKKIAEGLQWLTQREVFRPASGTAGPVWRLKRGWLGAQRGPACKRPRLL